MNGELVQQLSAWLAGTDIGLLELHGPDVRLRLRNDGSGVEPVGDVAHPHAHPRPHPLPHAGAGVEAAIQAAEVPRVVAIAASVGVFLHRHPLGDTLLADTGAVVRAGQVLGLLQIGALLLPVPAPQDGRVAGVWVAHGTPVGYGTPLVELHPL